MKKLNKILKIILIFKCIKLLVYYFLYTLSSISFYHNNIKFKIDNAIKKKKFQKTLFLISHDFTVKFELNEVKKYGLTLFWDWMVFFFILNLNHNRFPLSIIKRYKSQMNIVEGSGINLSLLNVILPINYISTKKKNTVEKCVKKLNENSNIIIFCSYKNIESKTGIYQIAKQTDCKIVTVKISPPFDKKIIRYGSEQLLKQNIQNIINKGELNVSVEEIDKEKIKMITSDIKIFRDFLIKKLY